MRAVHLSRSNLMYQQPSAPTHTGQYPCWISGSRTYLDENKQQRCTAEEDRALALGTFMMLRAIPANPKTALPRTAGCPTNCFDAGMMQILRSNVDGVEPQ